MLYFWHGKLIVYTMNTKSLLWISITVLIFCRCSGETQLKQQVTDLLHSEVILRGNQALGQEVATVTSFVAPVVPEEYTTFIRKATIGGLTQ